jgi:hypothetical protein
MKTERPNSGIVIPKNVIATVGGVDLQTAIPNAVTLYTTLTGLNGLIKCNGSGVFSAITDSHTNWDTAYSLRHTQNTDTGTSANTFTVGDHTTNTYSILDCGTGFVDQFVFKENTTSMGHIGYNGTTNNLEMQNYTGGCYVQCSDNGLFVLGSGSGQRFYNYSASGDFVYATSGSTNTSFVIASPANMNATIYTTEGGVGKLWLGYDATWNTADFKNIVNYNKVTMCDDGRIFINSTNTGSVYVNNLEVDINGFLKPISSADASAPNNSIYYSTTASKLVYKDSGGTVNNLY